MKTILFILILTISTLYVAGQTAIFKGVVCDKYHGDSLPFVSIIIFRNDTVFAKSQTDLNGKFEIKNIPAGKYSSKAMLVGYKTYIENGLSFQPNQVTIYNFQLGDGVVMTDNPKIEWRYFSISDSLGNTWCVDALTNKTDSLGKKQGLWKKYFMDYSDKKSGFSIGQIIYVGNYLNDKKEGKWLYFSADGTISKTEYYKNGKLIKKIK